MSKNKDSDDYNNEEFDYRKVPNDGQEEINIEPIDWDDI